MLLVHFGWLGGPLVWPFGVVSAAEGFFLLSGITLGRVGRRYAESGRARELSLRLLRRALWLLFANTLLVLALRKLDGSCACPEGVLASFWTETPRWLQIVSFDQPSVLHVLPRYALFLLLTPLVLAALRAGAGIWVGPLSALLWLGNRPIQGIFELPLLESGTTQFPAASWQLLFFVGVVAGHRRWGADDRGRLSAAAVAVAVVLAAGFVLLQQLAMPRLVATQLDFLFHFFGREYLGPLRLLNLLAFALVAWWVVDRWWPPISRWSGWLLQPLGQHALAAYLLHTPMVWALTCLPAGLRTPLATPAVAVVLLLLVLALVRLRPVQRILNPVGSGAPSPPASVT